MMRGPTVRAAPPPAVPALAEIVTQIHPEIRRAFPALEQDLTGGRRVYLNSGGGTITAEASARAMERAARLANAQDGTVSAGERATAEIHDRARRLSAEFLNAPSPGEISFHLSTSHALFNLSFAFRDLLRKGDNLVVTRIDHAANVTPWESIWGEDRGLEIRECGVRRDGTLDLDHLRRLIDRRTRIVAVTCASNGLGTVVPVGEVVSLARRFGRPDPPPGRARGRGAAAPGAARGGARSAAGWEGALVVVDAVHHAYHGPIDVASLGCDFLAFSGYKLFGPMCGVLWGRREWLDRLRPYRVEPNADETPVKYEQGTPNHAVLAGLGGAFDYLLGLGEEIERRAAADARARPAAAWAAGYPEGPRRRFKWALLAIREYEKTLSAQILEGFRDLAAHGVRLHGLAGPDRIDERDPTFLFEVRGRTQDEVKRRLWEEGRIEVPSGTYYSVYVYRGPGRRRPLRASFAHYDTPETARHFLATLGRIAGG